MPTVVDGRLIAPATLRGAIRVPSDKSIAHRALICSALADGESTIRLREPGADLLSTLEALRSLGADVSFVGDAATVRGSRLHGGAVDCGNSGTTMRLLAGALAGAGVSAMLAGDESLSRRPMERVAQPLRLMGADVGTTDGHAPLTVNGRPPLRALHHQLPVASAQVLGAICFAALSANGTTTVQVPGPTRDHTERLLAALGVEVTRLGTVTTLTGPVLVRTLDLEVPGDFSSAAAWLVAATVHQDAVVTLNSVGLNPTRTALIDILRQMGASIDAIITGEDGGEPIGDITVRSAAELTAVSIGPEMVPAIVDELPLLAVAMAAAHGTSEVRGAGELRVKESDRIAGMTAALRAIGAEVEELADGWRIGRGRPAVAQVVTHLDHRIAMAAAVAAWSGVATSVELDDPACVGISYASFWRDAALLGAGE